MTLERISDVRIAQDRRNGEHRPNLRMVAAGVRERRVRVGEGVSGNNEGVELAHDGDPRTLSRACEVGAHAGERKPVSVGQSEAVEPLTHEARGALLAEPSLRVLVDVSGHVDSGGRVLLDELARPLSHLRHVHGFPPSGR